MVIKNKEKNLRTLEKGENEEELEQDIDDVESEVKKLSSVINKIGNDIILKKIDVNASKPILQLKKGDKIKVDGIKYEIDAHYILMDHGKTKEMAIDIFNPKTDRDYQLRYFSNQAETSLEFYELQEILYVKKDFQRIDW